MIVQIAMMISQSTASKKQELMNKRVLGKKTLMPNDNAEMVSKADHMIRSFA